MQIDQNCHDGGEFGISFEMIWLRIVCSWWALTSMLALKRGPNLGENIRKKRLFNHFMKLIAWRDYVLMICVVIYKGVAEKVKQKGNYENHYFQGKKKKCMKRKTTCRKA